MFKNKILKIGFPLLIALLFLHVLKMTKKHLILSGQKQVADSPQVRLKMY